MKIAITGHRPERLAERTDDCRIWLEHMMEELDTEFGIEAVYDGMAEGVDIIAARAALEKGLELWCCYPYRRKFIDNLEAELTQGLDGYPPLYRVVLHEKWPGKGCYIERERYMVDNADVLLAVWDGKENGGTWQTIKYAREQGKKIYYFPWLGGEDGGDC